MYFTVRAAAYRVQTRARRIRRQLTKVLSLGIFNNEVPTLRHLSYQKRDRLLVRLDRLQMFGIVDEVKGVTHHDRQANDPVIAIFLVY